MFAAGGSLQSVDCASEQPGRFDGDGVARSACQARGIQSDFNQDFKVTFTAEEVKEKSTNYNFEFKPFPVTEAPGISVFAKDDAGQVYHTYSAYARGLERFMGVYDLLDIVPKGRDEGSHANKMQWVRHHDRYEGVESVQGKAGGTA
jgi:predicted dithiol-disulfide oxidoreductase (DUF899 family)